MAQTLEALIRDLGSVEDAAQRRYSAVYDEKRKGAQQSWEENDAALVRELGSLKTTYDTQRARTAGDTEAAYRQADRQALSRGMQRSSYNAASLSGIALSGKAALDQLGAQQIRQESDVQRRRTELKEEHTRQLAQLDAEQKQETLRYADELRLKIYDYQQELRREKDDYDRWLAEFEARYGRMPR